MAHNGSLFVVVSAKVLLQLLKTILTIVSPVFVRCLVACVSILLVSSNVYSQSLPDLRDRTSETLVGLANDSSDKTLEIGDFNGDGLEDMVIARADTSPVLLVNISGVLTNESDRYLPRNTSLDNAVYIEAFDANDDGQTDLAIALLNQAPRLLFNLGVDANGDWLGFDGGRDLPVATNSLVVESGDVDGDGFSDLFIIQVELATNILLINNGDGGFTDQSSRLGELADLQRGHSALLADVESDGDIDIVYIESDLFLHIYHNDGSGNYIDDNRLTFQNSDNFAYIFGAADFNGDGIFDYRQYSNTAPMAQMSAGFIDGSGLPVYLSRQDAPMQRGNRKHGTVHMRDIDGDGDTDYVLSSMLRNFGGLSNTFEGMRTEIVLNTGVNSGEFITFTGDDWGRQESMDMKILDVNGDGNMDLFVAHPDRYGVYLNGAPSKLVELQSVSAEPAQAGLAASFTASILTASNVQYSWDFGDGNTLETDSATVTHVFDTPGRYLVTLTATGALGSDQITVMHRVHEPLLSAKPESSSSIITFRAEGETESLWVVNPDNDTVTVLDAVSGAGLAEIPVAAEPRSIASVGGRYVLVASKHAAQLTLISATDLSIISTLRLKNGSMPHGLVIDAGSQYAYVVLEASGELAKIQLPDTNAVPMQVVDTINIGHYPRHLAIVAGTLYLSRFITPPVAGESTSAVATSGGAEIMKVDADTFQQLGIATLGYNNVEDSDNQSRGVPNYLTAPAIAPHGRTAVVGAKLDNIYRGTLRDGNAREHNVLVRGVTATLDLLAFTEERENRIDFDNNSPPSAVAFGPTGNLLFVVHEASRLIEVVDVYRGDIVFSTDVGFAPQGLALSEDGRRLFVHNYLSRDVSFFDLSELIDGVSDNAVLVRQVSIVGNEKLDPQILLGKRLFHDAGDARLSAQKYISCAVCHSEMGHDGRTWDFADVGEGLRNTIDLRGRGGLNHGNIHWTANFDEIHDFENDIREVFKGAGLMSDSDYNRTSGILDEENPKAALSADLDALAAFVDTLSEFPPSPYRMEDGALTESAIRGKKIFREANCAACHLGDEYTDSPLGRFHDIGTVNRNTGNRLGQPLPGNGLDTPTLRGLWLTAPYLHNGSADTLAAAVRAHTLMPGSMYVSGINAAQMDDLVAYLMQIDERETTATSSLDNDGDLIPDSLDPDDDNDNVPDTLDDFPLDAAESSDKDGDLIGDNRDPDDDNDGLSDVIEGDQTDTDSDAVPDRFDLDSDNDTILDVTEAGGADVDRNGQIDVPGQLIDSPADSDADGLYNHVDLQSTTVVNDGVGDFDISTGVYADLDINNDGVLDSIDGFVDTNADGVDDRVINGPVLSVAGGCQLLGAKAPFDPWSVILLLFCFAGRSRLFVR